MSWTVYQHINKTNKKRYIGITSTPITKRWKNGEGYTACPKFYSAIKKYGWDGFDHIVIKDGLPEQCAKTYEKILIKLYDTIANGYNLTNGGDGTCGYKFSEESKRKLSESHKGKGKGVPKSESHKQHISDNSGKKRAVLKYDLSGNLVEKFPSVKQAMESVGVKSTSHFYLYGNGDKVYKGFIWKYE